MDRAFGPDYAKSLASDLVIGALGSRSAQQALDDGVPPRQVWEAVCDTMELDGKTRWSHLEPVKYRRTRSPLGAKEL